MAASTAHAFTAGSDCARKSMPNQKQKPTRLDCCHFFRSYDSMCHHRNISITFLALVTQRHTAGQRHCRWNTNHVWLILRCAHTTRAAGRTKKYGGTAERREATRLFYVDSYPAKKGLITRLERFFPARRAACTTPGTKTTRFNSVTLSALFDRILSN